MLESVFSKLPPAVLPDRAAVSVRLYGGWYDRRRLSRAGIKLTAELARDFPAVITTYKQGTAHRVRTSASLARSLSIDPSTPLTHTYRVRSAPPNLTPKNLPFAGCPDKTACLLTALPDLLLHGTCPAAGCTVTVTDTMTRPEQKMVDSMLTVDLIHASLRGSANLVVVTADDDLWPGIRMALSLNANVHHVRPIAGQSLHPIYATVSLPNYAQYSL